MRRVAAPPILLALSTWVACTALAIGQVDEAFSASPDHPAIQYALRPAHDPVAALNVRLAAGDAVLTFERGSGYLRSVLEALKVSADSQLLVFSKTGVQGRRTSPANPRALLFNDALVIGYIRGAPFLEIAAQDPQQGLMFYTLNQDAQPRPQFSRQGRCLTCHLSLNTLDVPGLLVRSQFTAPDGTSLRQLGQNLVDHRTPLAQRWGGYYVTSAHASMRHMGNAMVTDEAHPESSISAATVSTRALPRTFDPASYPSSSSDIVALLVFDHQMRMMNLLTRIGWEVRVATAEHRLDLSGGAQRVAIDELVDYMLFVDEAPLRDRVQGASGFEARFSAEGPRDRKGRSLRELDLRRRLMRYPCSYMIYADAFDGLPEAARGAIYERLWFILSGRETRARYMRLRKNDRQAIIEILRDTKAGLPRYFFDGRP